MARHVRADVNTPFRIDLQWWERRGRNLERFLVEILGEESSNGDGEDGRLDYIDPETAEVYRMDATWARVLIDRAHRPDYITSATPLTNALLRALIENRNQPMSAVDLHRRINRSTPQMLLRVLQTARNQYGITPVGE
jgi:hypothetical protein